MTTNNEKDYAEWLWTAETCGLDWDNPENLPPAGMLDEVMLLAALQDAPEHIAKMPRELLTETLCVKAASNDWEIAKHLSAELKTEAVFRAVFVSSRCNVDTLGLFPALDQPTKERIAGEETQKRIDRAAYKALRRLALKELRKDTPRYQGITETEIEAKIAEIKKRAE